MQDVVDHYAPAPVIFTLWQALNQLSVIDPTCGSGAFLFAALNILEPLYDACLERMEQLVMETGPTLERSDTLIAAFRSTLDHVETHPNRRYFFLRDGSWRLNSLPRS
ncbi:MAG: SAM-dependent DNA methyltransferase [Candidatus Viridilinea halotolerans]|uniref:SAM-dependent DNA methyltransferase n=1 Tax=Candidatus Viridilinea halotolerans TaxID=2491704 RepID=A0A426TTJ9_9CHLR|nr:MAG: SAM-dependent DNA methyltransferase [Candidatus Viridilinea halotolerans]